MEGALRVHAGGRRIRMMLAENVLDQGAVDGISCLDAVFGIDEKSLATDRAANVGRNL